LNDTKQNVREALKDNFDTPTAMHGLLDLVTATNSYLQSGSSRSNELLVYVGSYLEKMLSTFGVQSEKSSTQSQPTNASNADKLIDTIVQFRSSVKSIALQSETETKKKLLTACDSVRAQLRDQSIRLDVIVYLFTGMNLTNNNRTELEASLPGKLNQQNPKPKCDLSIDENVVCYEFNYNWKSSHLWIQSLSVTVYRATEVFNNILKVHSIAVLYSHYYLTLVDM
jgi:hypothetical protein